MARLEVRIFGDPVLRQKARVVEDFDDKLAKLATDMEETMRAYDGVGLAANQVGVLKQLFTWDYDDPESDLRGDAVVNPKLTDASADLEEGDEGCLSFPGLFYPVSRPLRIAVDFQDVHGETRSIELTGHPARIWLHEMDHLQGVLFVDHLAAHDKRAAQEAMRQYRMEHGLDTPQPNSGGLLLGRLRS